MKQDELAELFAKLLGLFGLVYALVYVPQTIAAWGMYVKPPDSQFYPPPALLRTLVEAVGKVLVYGIGGAILLYKGRSIAHWLSREAVESGSAPMPPTVSAKGFQFCLRLLGVYILLRTAPLLTIALVSGVAISSRGFTSYPTFSPDWPKLLAALLQLALGVSLLRGGRWVVWLAYGKGQVA